MPYQKIVFGFADRIGEIEKGSDRETDLRFPIRFMDFFLDNRTEKRYLLQIHGRR